MSLFHGLCNDLSSGTEASVWCHAHVGRYSTGQVQHAEVGSDAHFQVATAPLLGAMPSIWMCIPYSSRTEPAKHLGDNEKVLQFRVLTVTWSVVDFLNFHPCP